MTPWETWGAEDGEWYEPEELGRGPGDSMMQAAILRALTGNPDEQQNDEESS